MAVAFDAATKSVRTTTADPWEWAHTPVGTPAGVLVVLINYDGATDHVSTVTYGGASLSEVVQATDTSGEQTNTQIWFLGSSVPTGTQTVSVDLATATGDDLVGWVITVTADLNVTEVIDSDSISQDAANPQVTLQYGGRQAMAFCALAGGLAAVSDYTLVANCSTIDNNDSGNEIQRIDRQTTAGTSDFTIGYTASSDDVSFCAVAIAQTERAATGLGSLTLTGLAPALLRGVALTFGVGALVFTGYAPTVTVREPIRPGSGAITLTGYAPAARRGPELRVTQVGVEYADAQSATLRATQVGVEYADAQSATLRVTQVGYEYATPKPIETRVTQVGLEWAGPGVTDYTISPDAGSLTLAGQAPVTSLGIVLTVPAGSLSLTGTAPAALQTVLSTPATGTLVYTGHAPVVATGAILVVPVGSLSLTGLAPTRTVAEVVTVPAGSLTVGSLSPTLGAVVTVPPGSLTVTGETPTTRTALSLTVPAGGLTLTGASPEPVSGRTIEVPAGSLTVTRYAVSLARSYVIPVPVGHLTVTGQAPALDAPRIIEVPTGTITLEGVEPVLGRNHVIVIDPGTTLRLTGTLAYNLVAPPDPVPVAATTRQIRRLRRAPALATDGGWLFHQKLELLLEAGVGVSDGQGDDPSLMLRWSDNGGHTWSHAHWTAAGKMGQYRRRAIWRRLGRSRNRVYEVAISDPVRVAWIGASLDVQAGGS